MYLLSYFYFRGILIVCLFFVGGNMAKDYAKKFYNSKQWKDCRTIYISNRMRIDGGLCEKCRQNQGYILHHTVPLTPLNINDPNITLNPALLSWECKDCHDQEEGHWKDNLANQKGVCSFGTDGQPIDMREL